MPTLRKDVKVSGGEVTKGLKVAVVGGTGGLGQAIARKLAGAGASVTVVGQTFRDGGVPGIAFVKADLSLMKEAVRVGRELPMEQLDVLLLTTGIFAGPKREETAEGLERDIAVSYLSRYAILREAGPRLKAGARVFVMGYPGQGEKGNPGDLNSEQKYASFATHMNTVAGNEALVLDAAKRWPQAKFFGLNPGLIKTNIRANALGGNTSVRFKAIEFLIGLTMMSAERYAEVTVPVLASRDLASLTGVMFNQKGKPIVGSEGLAVEQFMTGSEALLQRATKGA
jgi:NAD(P)-dependent dehydrogenase (short-subunit alcohol dehydrogenase family)